MHRRNFRPFVNAAAAIICDGSFPLDTRSDAGEGTGVRIVTFEHSRADGPGKILAWATARNHEVHRVFLAEGEPFPALDEFEFLIVMGGAMNIYEHRDHPWLVAEKEYLRTAIDAGKSILGICLGGQLLADVLGGKVTQNAEYEVGWWPVQMIDRSGPFADFPADFTVCQWHGDTFTLPKGARHVASSPGCRNQAFLAGDRVAGLQFHLEIAPCHIDELIDDLPKLDGRFVQTAGQFKTAVVDETALERALRGLLDALAGSAAMRAQAAA